MRNIIPMELTDLNSSIDMAVRPTYGGLPKYGVASGDIASFITNINYPLKKLEAGFKATQDFNGYDAPWAGGTKKNLCPPLTWKGDVNNTTGEYSVGTSAVNAATAELIPVDFTNNTIYVLSYDSSALPSGARNMIFAYNANKEYLGRVGGNASNPRTFDKNSFTTSTTSATGDPAYVRIKAYNVTYTEAEIANGKFQVESGDTATTFVPWANICPIVGVDEVNVYRTGRNIAPNTSSSSTSYGITFTVNADKSIHISGTATESGAHTMESAIGNYLVDGATYKFYDNNSSSTTYRLRLRVTPKDGSGMYSIYDSANPTFTVDKSLNSYGSYQIYVLSGVTVDATIYPMIMPADETDESYEQYKGQVYNADLNDTYYGGTLDLASGVLTVTHKLVDIGTKTITKRDEGSYFVITGVSERKYGSTSSGIVGISNGYEFYGNATSGTLVSNLQNGQFGYYATSVSIMVRNDGYTDADSFKAAMSGVYICYEVNNPQIVQLTAQEVESICGQNNIWADSGQVYVEYHFVEDFEE